MVSEYLSKCGVFLGERLLGANASNPHGHFEDRDVMDLHNSILHDSGEDWKLARRIVPKVTDNNFNRLSNFVERRNFTQPLWGFKDPRVCHFMPLWKSVVPDAKAVIVFRNPIACVNSLHKRHGYDAGRNLASKIAEFYRVPDLAVKIWIASNEALADFAESHPEASMVLSHQSITEGFPLAEEINRRWHLDLKPVNIQDVQDYVLGRSSSAMLRICDPTTAARARKTWARLLKLEETTMAVTGRNPTPHPELRFDPQNDLGQLLMEAELLRFENEFLRRALREARAATESDRKRQKKAPGKKERGSAEDAAELDAYRRDITYLLEKAGKLPYYLVFGRKLKVRRLAEKYGVRGPR